MKALLRPAFVLGLSIAIAATSLIGSLSVAFAASAIVTWSIDGGFVYEGDKPSLTGALTGPSGVGPYMVDITWGDGTADSYFFDEATNACELPAVCWTLHVQKTTPYVSAGSFSIVIFLEAPNGANRSVVPATVTVRPPNEAPTMDFEVTAGPEGGSSTLAVTFADTDVADTHTVSVDWGDGATTNSPVLAANVTTFDAAHVYADTGSYSVVVALSDSATPVHTVTLTKSVSPTNVGPTLGSLSLSPSSVVDGQELTLSGSFTDPGGTLDTFTLFVDWGDGNTSEQPLGTARSFSATHSYAAAGPATITAIVQDRDGASSGPASVSLVVGSSNHAPTGLAFEATATGANVVVTGSFTDSDAADADTVVVTWGDGDTERQTLAAGAREFTFSHVYLESNTYTVTVTVTDPSDASTSDTRPVVVTVPATSASAVIDEMSSLVLSLGIDRNTERWLLKKLDDLQSSLAYGNGQVCSSSGTLAHLMAFAQRSLSNEDYAALSAFVPQLESAAGCATTAGVQQSPKAAGAAAVTTTATPTTTAPATTQKKDTTAKDLAKATKSDTKPTVGRGKSH